MIYYTRYLSMSRILKDLRCYHADKLMTSWYSFMDSEKTCETPGTETKDFRNHSRQRLFHVCLDTTYSPNSAEWFRLMWGLLYRNNEFASNLRNPELTAKNNLIIESGCKQMNDALLNKQIYVCVCVICSILYIVYIHTHSSDDCYGDIIENVAWNKSC